MNHALTVGDVLIPLLIIGGIIGVGAVLIGLLSLFNPFRSGH